MEPVVSPLPDRGALAFAREAYRGLALYDPMREPCELDLSDNTNRFGVPPAARRVLAAADTEAITRYPAVYARDLKQAIADYAGVAPECVVTGCGSDDVLDSSIRAFTEPGDRLAYPDPTFPMLPVFARMNGLEGVAVPLAEDGDADAAGLLEPRARVTYLCSPNNPTGRATAPQRIERVLDAAAGVVILDEAYIEFASPQRSFAPVAAARGNLLVTRTLSKAFGLAGLRIGYGIGSPEIVAEVEKSRGPYKVGGLTERAAMAALTEDREWVASRVAETLAHRVRFAEALRGLGLRPLDSSANFVLVPVPAAAATAAAMRRAGVAVRAFPGLHRHGDALRISIGTWPQMERALAALGGALS